MLKKFLSTFIAVFTLITVVATSVYADFSITDFYPQTEELYTIKYDDELDYNIVNNINEADKFKVYEDTETEEFVIKADTLSKYHEVAIYPQLIADSTAVNKTTKIDDYFVISFDITRYAGTENTIFRIQPSLITGTNAYNGARLDWQKNALKLTDKNNSDVEIYSNMTVQSDSTTDNYHRIDYVMNSACQTDLYVDGVLVKEAMLQTDSSLRGKNFSALKFKLEGSSYDDQTVKLKNFKMYTATESGIVQDIEAITAENLTTESPDESGNYVLTRNLNLPTTGAGGSTITWNSSNEDIISSDGTIHRHSGYEKSDAVTLTAKIVNTGVEVSKNFTFYVKRKDFPATADMVGDYFVYDDFSNSNLQYRYSANYSSVSVSDEKLTAVLQQNKEAAVTIYFDESAKNIGTTGKYVVEFDICLNNDAKFRIDAMAGAQTGVAERFNRITKAKNEKVLKISSESGSVHSDGRAMSDIEIFESGVETHFKYLIDCDNQKFSLYVDDALLVKDCYRNMTKNGCGGIDPTLYNGATMTIDNLKVYKLADGAVFAPESSAKTISLNGENVSKIEATGTYAAKLNITDYTTEYTDDTDFAVALYNKNTHELSAVKVVKAKALKGTIVWNNATENYGLYAKTTIDVPADYENYYVKLMHWNGTVPVSSSVTVD